MAIYRSRKDDLENSLNKGALWAITYGDLMSYLMIFFLVLFSFSLVKADKRKSRKYEESLSSIQKVFGGKANVQRLERAKMREKEEELAGKLQESIVKSKLAGMIRFESTEKKIRLVLGEGVLFDSGRAVLQQKAKKFLVPIIEKLKTVPNQIIVEGHTDNVPIVGGRYRTNWELSMARAYSVIDYMEKQGIDSKRLAGIGYGENRPVASNATKEGRARNRRIEILLIKAE